MKTRCGLVCLGVLLLYSGILEAKTENGLSVIVQKVTLDSEKDREAFLGLDKVKRALGLKIEARNTSFKDLPEGLLKYTVIVKKWDLGGEYVRHSGEEKLPALLRGQSLTKVIGKVPLSGIDLGSRNQFMDTIEAYQVIVMHEGKQTLELTSSSTFDALNKKATDAPK